MVYRAMIYVLLTLLGISALGNIFQWLSREEKNTNLKNATSIEKETIKALSKAERRIAHSDSDKKIPSARDIAEDLDDFNNSGEAKIVLEILNEKRMIKKIPNPGGSGDFWRVNEEFQFA